MSAPELTGRQPFIVWRCEKCHHIALVQWVGGTHRDPYHETRCNGQPIDAPFYLISADEYLDVVLAAAGSAGNTEEQA